MSGPEIRPGVVVGPGADDGSVVNTALTPKRRERKSLEHTARGVTDIVRALGRRIGAEHDPEDLPHLQAIEDALEVAWRAAVDGLREQGRSDTDIGRALGTTRQAVGQRWPRVDDDVQRGT